MQRVEDKKSSSNPEKEKSNKSYCRKKFSNKKVFCRKSIFYLSKYETDDIRNNHDDENPMYDNICAIDDSQSL